VTRRLPAVVLMATVLAAGCGRDDVRSDDRRIRVGHAGALDLSDMPAEIAHDALRRDGYNVQLQAYPTIEVVADALARGDVDVAVGSTRSFWAAIGRGAPIRSVMEHVSNIHRMVTAAHGEGCAAFGDRRFALQSEGAAGTAFARAWLTRHCPNLDSGALFVPGSPNRMAAMLSGALTATVLQLSDVLRLQRLAPQRFVMSVDFAREWPGVRTTLVHVNAHFASAYPDRVRDYLRARLAANRRVIADAAPLLEMARARMGDESDWLELAPIYRALPAWQADGGLSVTDVATTLDFLVRETGLKASIEADAVADLSFLDALGRELGPASTVPAPGHHGDPR